MNLTKKLRLKQIREKRTKKSLRRKKVLAERRKVGYNNKIETLDELPQEELDDV